MRGWSSPTGGGSGSAAAEREQIVQAGERRSAQIESLRAVAAVAVLIAHCYSFTHPGAIGAAAAQGDLLVRLVTIGHAGVFLFFALTGYLLFWPFARHYFGDGDPIALGPYALNRACGSSRCIWSRSSSSRCWRTTAAPSACGCTT